MSAPVRDPLYTSSCVLVWPSQKQKDGNSPARPHPVIQLRGIVFRSRLLNLAHVICSPRLSQFVQQFLARLVLAYPERATLWYVTLSTLFEIVACCLSGDEQLRR
jgi:hypothetical protein